MSKHKRRFECPFGCGSGYTDHDLKLHLNDKHTRLGLAEKIVELLKRLEHHDE